MATQRFMAAAFALSSAAILSACGGSGGDDLTGAPVALTAQASCDLLASASVPATEIGLPTRGGTVTSATLVAATDGLPEHCAVDGSIAPMDAAAPPIKFRVNLPTQWNGKVMHFGGGGFNGVVMTATSDPVQGPPGTQTPLQKGYVTLGSDSGHSGGSLAFALNAESFENFSHAQMKKTLDTAKALIRKRYGASPQRVYWVGSSQGGREGLMVAQRYGQDYDGVYANVPVGASFTAKAMQGLRIGQSLAQAGAWLNPAKVALLQNAARSRCDIQDGLADGTLANPGACDFDSATLRCSSGADEGDTCLSDTQLAAVRTIHTGQSYGFELANGITSYPASQWGSENDPAGNWRQWITGASQGSLGQIFNGGANFLRYAVAQDSAFFDPLTFDPAQWRSRLQEVSRIHDASNPDLSVFRSRGGKIIITDRGGDYSHSPQATADYVEAVQARMGQDAANQFLRFYVFSGADHSSTPTAGWPAARIDWVSILEAWVEQGHAPADKLRLTAHASTAPFAETAARPLCRYPTYPHYTGGDVNDLASFACRSTTALVRPLP